MRKLKKDMVLCIKDIKKPIIIGNNCFLMIFSDISLGNLL